MVFDLFTSIKPVFSRKHLMASSFNLCIKCLSVFQTRYRAMETIVDLWLLYRDLMEINAVSVTTSVCYEFIREKKNPIRMQSAGAD